MKSVRCSSSASRSLRHSRSARAPQRRRFPIRTTAARIAIDRFAEASDIAASATVQADGRLVLAGDAEIENRDAAGWRSDSTVSAAAYAIRRQHERLIPTEMTS